MTVKHLEVLLTTTCGNVIFVYKSFSRAVLKNPLHLKENLPSLKHEAKIALFLSRKINITEHLGNIITDCAAVGFGLFT